MSYLSVTCTNPKEIEELETLGIKEVTVVLKDSAFSSLPSFSFEEIVDINKKIKAKGMRLCVNMNALFSESEIASKQELMLKLLDEGIDYILFSDFGLLRKAKEVNKEDHLIYDPVFLLTNSIEAKTINELNLAYINISSLLTKEEIMDIASNINNSSLVIHGHLLMSATKRKLLSEYSYEKRPFMNKKDLLIQEETRDGLMPVHESDIATLIYSDFIQESFDEIKDFINSGIKRLEIQTQYLDFEVVKETIKAYTRIINGEDVNLVKEEFFNKVDNKLLSKGYYGEKSIK